MKIKDIITGSAAIAFVVLFPHWGIIPLPFGYTVPVMIFIWLFLKYFKENFSAIGFSLKNFRPSAILTGAVTAILVFSFLNWVFLPLLEKFMGLAPAELGDFKKIRGNPGFFVFILLMGWIVGGFYEEIVFHGFIFTRLEKIISGRNAIIIHVILTNTIFALYHLQLGTSGVINAFVAGTFYHAVMLKFKRNLWYAIFCHAFYDTIALTFIYAGY